MEINPMFFSIVEKKGNKKAKVDWLPTRCYGDIIQANVIHFSSSKDDSASNDNKGLAIVVEQEKVIIKKQNELR